MARVIEITSKIINKIFGKGDTGPKLAIIMRGIPGSGKSTIAALIEKRAKELGLSCAIHSSDAKFMVDGEYVFVPEKLGVYHAENLSEYKESLTKKLNVVIADNTNVRQRDAKPYVESADAASYKVIELYFSPTDLEVHVKCNVHSVPAEVVEKMYNSLKPLEIRVDERYTMNCATGAHLSEYTAGIVEALFC